MFGDLFLKVTRIICLIKQDLNLWNRNIEWDLITAILWASVTSSRSNIGITGLPSRYIDTQTSSSDILTKGNFTRDDWNSILHLFNISHFSSTWCAKNSSLTSCSKTMAKRMQEQKVEERSVAKSISTAMNLSSHVPASSSSAKGPIASKSLGYSELQGNLKAGQEEIRHPTQRRFLKGCWKMHSLAGWWTEQGRKLPKQTKVRNHGIFLNLNPEAILRKWRRNLLQEAGNGHIISICLQQSYLIWIESVRSYERFMVEVQRMTWMTSTWTPLYGVYSWTSHLRQHFILVETMCRIYDPPRINSSKACEKVIPSDGNIEDQREVNKLTTILTKSLRGDRRVYYVRKVLRLRMPQPTSSPTQCSVWGTWVINQSNLGRTKFNGIWNIAMSKIWIESMESRWSSSGQYSQDSQRWASSKRLRNIWQKYIVNLSISKTGSSSCQCTTTLNGENKETQKSVRKISYSCESCSQIPARTLVISGTLIREEMARNSLWTGLLNKWFSIFAESRHPFFRATSALERGELRCKGKGKKSFHNNGSEENIELILRTVISANQLVQRTVQRLQSFRATWCKRIFGDSQHAYRNSCCWSSHRRRAAGKLAARVWTEIRTTTWKTRNYPNCAAMLVWRLLKKDKSSSHLKKDQMKWRIFAESAHRLDVKEHPVREGGFSQERYGIEILIESLFRDGTAPWFRIVNGIIKYVTETSETISLENVEHRATGKLVAKARPRPKLGVTLSPISIPFHERKWIDINPQRFRQDCFAVSKVMIRLLRHGTSSPREDNEAVRFDDFVEGFKVKFVGTSEWTVEAWISFMAKGGKRRTKEKVSILPEPSLFQTALVSQSYSGTFRKQSRWSRIARQCTVAGGLFRVHLPHREYKWNVFNNQRWIDPRRKKSQKGKTICVFHCSEPDGRWSECGGNCMRLQQAKDRSIQKYLETTLNKIKWMQLKTRSEERIAILSDTITRNRSLQHTTCDLDWKTGMHGDEGGVIPQSILFSKTATCCTQSEFAKWTTRSTRTIRKNILWPPKRIAELQGNLVQQRWLQNAWHTPFSSRTAGHASQRQSKSWFRSLSCKTCVRLKRSMNSARSRRSWSPIWTIRRSSSLARLRPRSNAPTVHLYWEIGIVYCICRRNLTNFAENSGVWQEQLRRLIKSSLGYQK